MPKELDSNVGKVFDEPITAWFRNDPREQWIKDELIAIVPYLSKSFMPVSGKRFEFCTTEDPGELSDKAKFDNLQEQYNDLEEYCQQLENKIKTLQTTPEWVYLSNYPFNHLSAVARLEVIDGHIRSYINTSIKAGNCVYSFQDSGKTLKIFIGE